MADDRLLAHNPELFVLELLGHALGVARRALAILHPETGAAADYGPLADECHYAMLIAADIDVLTSRLAKYRWALEASVFPDYDDDSEDIPDDIPF
jgi:hypothetical protein